jgi:hypothetical protein
VAISPPTKMDERKKTEGDETQNSFEATEGKESLLEVIVGNLIILFSDPDPF